MKLTPKQIERRVDLAMDAATHGLLIPLSALTKMGKEAKKAVEDDHTLEGEALVQKCRAIMIANGATLA